MIARDIVGRRDTNQPFKQGREHQKIGVFIEKITVNADKVGVGVCNSAEKTAAVRAELPTVQVGNLRNAKAVKRCGQGR